VVKDLEITVTTADGKEAQGFLYNAFTQYMIAPETKDDILAKYVGGLADMAKGISEDANRTQIVPILKAKAWVQETSAHSKSLGGKEFEGLYEPYNEDLVVVYAQDTPRNIHYISACNGFRGRRPYPGCQFSHSMAARSFLPVWCGPRLNPWVRF
jgi:hypothetical protein